MPAKFSEKQLHSMATTRGIEPGFVPKAPSKRIKNNNEESRSQKMLIKWWSTACQKFNVPEFLLFSIPNGMAFGGKEEWQVKTSIIRGKNAKLEGLRPGVPDLFLAVPQSVVVSSKMVPTSIENYGGLFIEMKTEKGVVPPEQTLIHSLLRSRGYKVCVCRSTEEAIETITTYLT